MFPEAWNVSFLFFYLGLGPSEGCFFFPLEGSMKGYAGAKFSYLKLDTLTHAYAIITILLTIPSRLSPLVNREKLSIGSLLLVMVLEEISQWLVIICFNKPIYFIFLALMNSLMHEVRSFVQCHWASSTKN